MKIFFIVSEVAPYSKIGGLADVGWALPRALKKLGHEVKVFTPKFGHIDEKKFGIELEYEHMPVMFQNTEIICNIKKGILPDGLEVYLLENQEFYELRANVYGYTDDTRRFALLSRGALEFLKKANWYPNIIHSNDWLTGLVPNLLKTEYKDDPNLQKVSSVFTIHVLAAQGTFDKRNISEMERDSGLRPIPDFFSDDILKLNGMIRGIIYSDIMNTVSEKYAKEILSPQYGEGLDRLLMELRDKLSGIRNGVDYDVQNPEIDPDIYYNYNLLNVDEKVKNKLAFQKEFDLEENPDIPLVAFIGRFSEQKGLSLIEKVIPKLLDNVNFQFAVVGGGDAYWENYFNSLINSYPGRVGGYTMISVPFAQKLYAASDIFIYPSRFEPCGIAQVIAMKYGSVPVVRETGGLADTVKNYDTTKRTGTGFVFKEFDDSAFMFQLVRALETYQRKDEWERLRKRVMKEDFSWKSSAVKYTELYRKAIIRHRKWMIEEGFIVAKNPVEAFSRYQVLDFIK